MSSLIVSDVDGVVLDFYKGAARVLEDMLGREMVKVDDRPATRYRYGLTSQEYQDMRKFMLTHSHGWGNLPVLDGAVEAIGKLKKAGHEVVFLSSCGQALYELRRQNLDNIGLSNCKLICVESHHDNSKGQVLEKLDPIAFIDDHMTMLAQAGNVPHRVWIDHGCSLELDEYGFAYIDNHEVARVNSLCQWVSQFLKI